MKKKRIEKKKRLADTGRKLGKVLTLDRALGAVPEI